MVGGEGVSGSPFTTLCSRTHGEGVNQFYQVSYSSQGEVLLLSIIIISSLGPGGSCGIIYIVMGRDKRSSRRMCAEGVKWLYGW